MIRRCEICGKDYTAKLERAKYCSPACSQKAWRLAHPDLYKERMRERYARLTPEELAERKRQNREWRSNNRDRVGAYRRDEHKRLRDRVLAAYGAKCDCCGESRREFLAIDHRHGGGNAHKRKVGRGLSFLRSIIKAGYPDWIRILCHNCNLSHGAYGYCPHDRERAA